MNSEAFRDVLIVMERYRESVGTTPADESCAQVGQTNYEELARRECRTYIAQLRRMLKARMTENEQRIMGESTFRLEVKGYPHDFGTYYEVEASYEIGDDSAEEVFNMLVSSPPAEWDDEARRELGL